MPTETPVPDSHPLMIAWKLWQRSERYQNARRWLNVDATQHADGALWAAFQTGFFAGIDSTQKTGETK